MYLAGTEPLGPHSEAMRHVLHARGATQLYDRPRFALWRVANQRLQSRQILLREGPNPDQMSWLSMLDDDRPDIHMTADILRINALCAAAKKAVYDSATDMTLVEQLAMVQQLAQEMDALLVSVESWDAQLDGVWKPQDHDPRHITQPHDLETSTAVPIPLLTCPRMLLYHDIWLAHMSTFFGATKIVLRESLVELLRHGAHLSGEMSDLQLAQRIQEQQAAVDRLSGAVIRSFPALMGFTRQAAQTSSPRQGKMAGRSFILFPMWVIQRAEFTSPVHKATATEVLQWIKSSHGLG